MMDEAARDGGIVVKEKMLLTPAGLTGDMMEHQAVIWDCQLGAKNEL